MRRNILVTAVGGRSIGAGLLHALKRAGGGSGRERWRIIAADADPFSWGLYVADKAVLLPTANDPEYLPALLNIIEQEDIQAIVPGSEAETVLLSQRQAELPVPVICNRPNLMELMLDKFSMTESLKALGLPHIETYPIAEWRTALVRHDYPFIVKPTVATGGSRDLNLVLNREELLGLLPSLPNSGQFCIQPYIGTGDDEYTVGVLTDRDGNLVDSIVMRRKLVGLSLLKRRSHHGKIYSISTGYSQGIFIRDRGIQEFCENLALSLGSIGPLNIQLRKDGDRMYVFEIHPRFSGTSTMRADLGFNEPDILLRNRLDGERFARIGYPDNVAAIRAFEHVLVPPNNMLGLA